MIRVRLHYSKGESLKYTGHLDLHRVWERSIRRAGLPLAYSQGFHPQPRIQQACPLPLGFTSVSEIIDLWLTNDLPLDDIQNSLLAAMHPGIEINRIYLVPLSDPPLQTIVSASDYLAVFIKGNMRVNFEAQILDMLSMTEILRERRGKPYDLRKLVQQLKLISTPEAGIFMCLSALPGATGRPEEVLDYLGVELNTVHITRTGLVFSDQIESDAMSI